MSFSLDNYKRELNLNSNSKDNLLQETLLISTHINQKVNLWRLKALACAIAVSHYFGNNSKAGSLLLKKKFEFKKHSIIVRLYNKIVGTIPPAFIDKSLYNYRPILDQFISISEQVINELVLHFTNHYWDCHGPRINQSQEIPLSTWEQKLVTRPLEEDEEGDDISVVNAGNDGVSDRGSDRGEPMQRNQNKCDWFFIILDILLRVMGIWYVKINIFKNKPKGIWI
jgi:hypothetical protein